jgi:peptide/nickel transport system substrate-binding protein
MTPSPSGVGDHPGMVTHAPLTFWASGARLRPVIGGTGPEREDCHRSARQPGFDVNKRSRSMLITLLLLASACTGGAGDEVDRSAPASRYPRGGTLRVASEHYTYDPQISYAAGDWEVLRCCLLRTLFTYNGRPTQEGGAILRPDLASGMGSLSSDGLTWTFTLKPGIHYAPPLEDTIVTAADIARALEREGDLAQGYHFYYAVIDGFEAFEAGAVDSISGITVADERTLIVHLTRPSGDLPYLFAMPATAPIPGGVADGHRDGYDRFLVSSGPYMFEGSEDLDFSLPAAEQKPVTGYQPRRDSAILVRNPSWDVATDAIRGAYVDRIALTLHAGNDAAGRAARAGQVERNEVDLLLDGFGLSINPGDAERYRGDPSLVGGLLTGQQNNLATLDMDLAVPPFDDLDVRRAVIYAIDREAILSGPGIAFAGSAALPEHLAPDSLEGGLLSSYDPYPDHRGNLDAAQRAMAASKYDHDGDGVCDDPVCRNVQAGGVVKGLPRAEDESFAVQRSLRAIGIDLDVKTLGQDNSRLDEQFTDGRLAITLEVSNEWFADYPNGTQFFTLLYASTAIEPLGVNDTLVGASRDQLRALGRDPINVPSVDDRIEACQRTIGADQVTCWAKLDQFMMEQVVPAVPILIPGIQTPFSTRVVHASIDQWTAVPALDQVALAPGSD